jgi:hypothetical protein
MFKYEYALRSSSGKYYTGRVNSDEKPNHWLGNLHEAFTYTLEGAYKKKDNFECFKDFEVVRIS